VSARQLCDSARQMSDKVQKAVGTLREVVYSVAPKSVSGEDAQQLVELLAEAERVVASGIARLTPRVMETGVYAKAGHASGPDWLAAVSGSSAGAARTRLAAAERAAIEPHLARSLREATLSAPELKVLSDAALAAPAALPSLVSMATGDSSYKELSDAAHEATCRARSAESARQRRARVQASRHFVWHQVDSGGIRGEFLCDEVAWARVAPRLEAEAKRRWKAAGSFEGESLGAHRLDLLAGAKAGAGATVPQALVLIDAAALRRGALRAGDTCEIDGVGPVSLAMATELLDEASVRFLVKTGRDIATVSSPTRTLPRRTSVALVARDRTCAVPGCGKRLGLEADHCEVDYGAGGPTTLSNLVRLCPAHHDMKTNGGWKIVGPPGQRTWVAPERPPTAGRIARARRVSAAKAKRNLPRRT
jgi:hypothetical protein